MPHYPTPVVAVRWRISAAAAARVSPGGAKIAVNLVLCKMGKRSDSLSHQTQTPLTGKRKEKTRGRLAVVWGVLTSTFRTAYLVR